MSGLTTNRSPKGINVNLLLPVDGKYLCEKICHAKNFPTAKISKRAILGYFGSPQLSMDGMLMLDYLNHNGKWRYVPEVSFNMKTKTPTPIMSKSFPRLPYWGFPRNGTSRPDVIIIDGADNHALNQKNIIRVVEVKFGKDELQPNQLNNYIKIAGNPKNVTVIPDDDCACTSKKNSQAILDAVMELMSIVLQNKFIALLRELGKRYLPIYSPTPQNRVQPVFAKEPIQMKNLATNEWEWVTPTAQDVVTGVVVAVIVVGVVTGVAEAGAVLVVGSRFVIAGAQALAARYGAAAMGRLAQTAF
jgi:hypothetical protein